LGVFSINSNNICVPAIKGCTINELGIESASINPDQSIRACVKDTYKVFNLILNTRASQYKDKNK